MNIQISEAGSEVKKFLADLASRKGFSVIILSEQSAYHLKEIGYNVFLGVAAHSRCLYVGYDSLVAINAACKKVTLEEFTKYLLQ